MRKISIIAIIVLLVVLTTVCFISCKKDETPVEPTPVFTGVKVYFLNDYVTNVQEVTITDAVTTLEYTYDQVKDADEGLITLLDISGKDYSKTSGGIYTQLNTVILSNEEAAAGTRIRVFTNVDEDKLDSDTAQTIRIEGQVLTQTNKLPELLNLKESTYILVAKVQV